MTTVIEFSNSPYPGLRPFRYDESDVFFGRERQIDLLIERLARNHFLAVIGSSGCGKSSLVRAGLLPALNAGFMAQVGSRWRIVEMRPGDHPVQRLTCALTDAHLFGPTLPVEEASAFIEACLRRGPLGIVEVLNSADALRDQALLLLVDQFEETFRYSEPRPLDEAEAFVALILASTAQRNVPIYVVLTMRSDYLGDCAAFRDLAEAVSNSQYLTPRLTRGELKLAIEGPARVFGGQIDPKLLNRLLNDFDNEADQLPLLQHALACMWERQVDSGSDSPHLTMADCEAIGGVRMALSNQADAILAELPSDQQHIAQAMFRRLTGSSSGRRDVRAPSRVAEVAEIACVAPEEVIAVVEAFARTDRGLLLVPEGPLRADSMLDICHESLIRQWTRLSEWSEKEALSAETYRLLEQTARRWKKGEAALWSTPDLENALAWEAREKPTATWARRYGGDFDRAMEFLRASETRHQADVAAKEASRRHQLRRYRQTVYGLIALLILTSGAVAIYWYATQREYATYYNTFVEHWGVPQGYGRLTEAQVRERPLSIRIVTHGRFGRVLRMEAVNSFGDCEPENSITQPLDNGSDNNPLTSQRSLNECKWVYVPDTDEHGLIYEKALNRHDELVWGLAFPPQTDRQHQQAYYVGPDGSLKAQKNIRLHSVEVDYVIDNKNRQRDGLQITERYFTYAEGAKKPEPGKDNVYGVTRERDANGLVIRETSLGSDGRTIVNNQDGVAIETVKRDTLGNMVEIAEWDKSSRPVLSKSGYHLTRMTYDDNGNRISQRYFGTDDRPVRLKDEGFHEIRTRYEHGHAVENAFFDVDGSPVHGNMLVHKIVMSYDRDRLIETRMFDVRGKPVAAAGGTEAGKLTYDPDGNIGSASFVHADGSPAFDVMGVHQRIWVYDSKGRPVRETTLDIEGKPTRGKGWTIGSKVLSSFAYGTLLGYDDRGETTSIVFIDRNGAPLSGNHRYAKMRFKYDDRGNQTETAYFDALDHPVLLSETGYAKMVSTYDDRRNVIKEELYDEYGQRTIGNKGYATLEKTYDERDRIAELRYFGMDNKPILLGGRYVALKRRYDGRDNLIEETLLDIDHRPVAQGQAGVRWKFDDRDRMIEEAYFDTNGKPFVAEKGYAMLRNIFDADGSTFTQSQFDADGHHIAERDGCWALRFTKNARGSLLDQTCLGADMKPVRSANGFSIRTVEYDAHGNRTEDAYRDEHGQLLQLPNAYAVAAQTYNQFDDVTGQDFRATDGKLVMQSFGYASMRSKYDGTNLVEESYYGTDEKLALRPDGYAMARYAYDDRDNQIETAYLGTDAKPRLQPEGYAIVRRQFDRNNNQTELAFYDEMGRLIQQSDGYAIERGKFDSRGNQIEYAYFGVDEMPVQSIRGYASVRSHYDMHDHQISEAYFDRSGARTCPDIVYTRYCTKEFAYDAIGRLKSIRYVGPNGDVLVTATFDLDANEKTPAVRYAGTHGEALEYHEVVLNVDPNSQAEKLLKKGDIIVSYAGFRIESSETMTRLTRQSLGDSRELKVLRDGKLISLQVKPGRLGFTDGTQLLVAR
ncbi:PDZ domain-containing protein [Paraburkholderia sp. Tr-20389]|uniref:nSTAND1 domain-containing NTPase n=1 Tax=Paraburkholderia sp. Tr-20389 TaxID=2703903 RepID=UPI001F1210C2|nr:PDZ domain-containing protein [Paraburkholderia sp. Tr-20389]